MLSPGALGVRTSGLAKTRANRDLIRKAARRHHATNIQIFGSVAHGEDGPNSNIDFLVDLEPASVLALCRSGVRGAAPSRTR